MGIVQGQQKEKVVVQLEVDTGRAIKPTLKIMQSWSLFQVRQLFQQFVTKKQPMLLSRTEFSRLHPVSHKIGEFLFAEYGAGEKYVVMLEFVEVLVLCSFSHYVSKLHMLFLLFDLAGANEINFKHFTLMIKVLIAGYCRLTAQPLPKSAALQKFIKSVFSKSELNRESTVELKEMIDWLEGFPNFKEVFLRFQPPVRIRQSYQVFRPFSPGNEKEFNRQIQLLQKLYKSDKLLADLGYMRKCPEMEREDRSHYALLPHLEQTTTLVQPSALHQSKESKVGRKHTSLDVSKLTLGQLRQRDIFMKTSILVRPVYKKKSSKLTVKGLSKHSVFSLCEYFDYLSNHKGVLTVNDFIEAMNANEKVPNMRSIANNLFNNYIDRGQTNHVTFLDFLKRLYPDLDETQLSTVKDWVAEYEKICYSELKRTKKVAEGTKMKVLPRACMGKILQIFHSLDEEKKGYLTLDNLRHKMNYSFTDKELEEHFRANDQGKGRLDLQDFIRFLLPHDYAIDTKDDDD